MLEFSALALEGGASLLFCVNAAALVGRPALYFYGVIEVSRLTGGYFRLSEGLRTKKCCSAVDETMLLHLKGKKK